MRRDVVQRGIVPCQECGKPHHLRRERTGVSWADRKDGHYYHPMTAEQVTVHFMARESGRHTVEKFAPALRRLAQG